MTTYKILVIDDSKQIRKCIREILTSDNLEILEAKDGAKGLSLIYKEFANLQIIFLNLILPIISGLDILWLIQIDNDLEKVPVVIMSSIRTFNQIKSEYKNDILDFEYCAFLKKLFQREAPVTAIKSAFSKTKLHYHR